MTISEAFVDSEVTIEGEEIEITMNAVVEREHLRDDAEGESGGEE